MLGGPLQFDGFKSPVLSLMMSLVIGAAAGLSTADDAGRRYLIGVAAAAQSGIFAVWAGFALVLGFPDRATTIARLLTLPLNVCAIGIAACVSYALIGLRRAARGQPGDGVMFPAAEPLLSARRIDAELGQRGPIEAARLP